MLQGTSAYCRGEGYICLLQRGGVHLPTAEGRGTSAHCRGEGHICPTAEWRAQPVLQLTDSDLRLWSQVVTQDSQSQQMQLTAALQLLESCTVHVHLIQSMQLPCRHCQHSKAAG